MAFGYSRKELGNLHKEFYEERLTKATNQEAFQQSLMSMIKAMIDVIDANNSRFEEDVKSLVKKKLNTDIDILAEEEMQSLLKKKTVNDVKSKKDLEAFVTTKPERKEKK